MSDEQVTPAISMRQWGDDVKHWYDKMCAAFELSVRDGSSCEFNSFDAGYTAGIADALSKDKQ